MSQENVEVVRRLYDASARRDREAVFALYDPEVEWDPTYHPMGEMFGRERSYGHAGLREWFRDWYESFESFEHTCEELIDAGEQVISVGTDRGIGRGSGAEVVRALAGVWTIRDGRVVRVVWYATREQALDAVGLADSGS